MGVLFIYGDNGIRKAGLGTAGAKNSPVDCFLGRGRIQASGAAVRRDVGRDPATLPAPTVILSQTSGLSFRIIQPYTAPKYPDIRKGNRYAGTFR